MGEEIDELDLKIVLQLQENGRATITELADKVGSSRPTVTNRLKRLMDEEFVIVTGGVSMTKFGYKMACIGLEVKSSETRAEFERCLTYCPRVVNIFRTTDKANLHIALWGEDDKALHSTVEAMRDAENVDVVYAYYLGTPVHGEVPVKVYDKDGGVPPCEKDCTECHRYENIWCPGCPISSCYRNPMIK